MWISRESLRQRAIEAAGTDSSQATSSLSTVAATIRLADGDLAAVLPEARSGWSHYDSTDGAVLSAAAAAAAANEPSWALEARDAYVQLGRRGRLPDGQLAALDTIVAMTEGRWSDARSTFVRARRDLKATSANFWLAILSLAVGTRGAGHMPEAEAAMAAAQEFFRGVRAESFVDRYRAAFVPGSDAQGVPVAAPETSEVPST